MPEVTSRWQGVPSQKPLRARKTALETACGALVPSRVIFTGPQDVVSVSAQDLPAARLFGGGVGHDFGVAGGVTVGEGQGFAAAVEPPVADAVGDPVAD